MDVSVAPIGKGAIFFCNLSSRRPYPPSSIQFGKNLLRKTVDQSFLFLKTPNWICSAAADSRVVLVSAHFRRKSKRRNSLREKLIGSREDRVRDAAESVSFDSNLTNSAIHFQEDVERIESNVNLDTGVGGVGEISSESFDFPGNSALRSELETREGQYRKDSEFWGIGSGPVFTIFQDSDGNAIRVIVNEDEIEKRSPIKTWSPGEKERVEEFIDLKSKISHAKLIAKEIEAGEYSVSRNSSIAEFVVEDRESSVVESRESLGVKGFNSAAIQSKLLSTLFPQIGLTLLCGWAVFWAVKKMFVRDDRVEFTREEVEMLRRKKKSRMEREEEMKGSVKVLQDVQELPMASGKRPQLDRNELISSIVQAKKSRENLVISDSPNPFDTKGPDFDRKVREIREMARKVRESERQAHAETDEESIHDELLSDVPASQIKNIPGKSSAYAVGKSTMGVAVHDGNPGTTRLAGNEMCTESESFVNNVPGGESSRTFGVDEAMSVNKAFTETISENTTYHHAADFPKDGGIIGQFEKDSCVQQQIETNNSLADSVSEITQTKPTIIRSVTEAREYLAQKRKIPRAAVQNKATRINRPTTGCDTDNISSAREPLGIHTQISNHLCKAVDPSKVEKPCDVKVATPSHEPSGVVNAASVIERPLLHHVSGVTDELQNADILSHNKTVKMENSNDEHRTVQRSGLSEVSDLHGSSSPEAPLTVHFKSKMTGAKNQCEGDRASHSEEYANLEDNVHFSQGNVGIDISGIKNDEIEGSKDKLINLKVDVVKSSNSHMSQDSSDDFRNLEPSASATITGNFEDQHCIKSEASPPQISKGTSFHNEAETPVAENIWLEKNFGELNPVIEKIRAGFKDNYAVAKDKAQEISGLSTKMSDLRLMLEDEELAWMKDDNLVEIVFQVRENELAGRDPFHLMDDDDKRAFYEGLERKAEKVNEKLLAMHEWIHSRVENLDYGADGISLDDPLEKIVPCWKGPALDDDDFLKGLAEQREAFLAGVENTTKEDSQINLQKSDDFPKSDSSSVYPIINGKRKTSAGGSSPSPKTLIECSDGSSTAGKKTGKEHWQHTKRWSQGFLEVYNAETDPEMKSIMKDMGTDLDRWITEKEIKDVGDLMTRIPKRKRRYIEKKMDKLKREMQMFGAQAVVSKYREYADEQDEDYLWWLDLQYVLCIELYTIEDGKAKVGFYSLEMAADLELEPKQYHVIAFEDPGDSKNFSYILQSHMDMLGSGKAFVVARPPKDAFREAKENGFNVTVIRKGEFKLNVDQTLEEVEEEIAEVGSKVYHDLIMRERAVDIRTIMKGVSNADKSTKRISNRRLKKPART